MGIKNRVQVSHEMTALEKAQLCAAVVVAFVKEDSSGLEAAVANMKDRLGSQWTATHAWQFLSGRQAREALVSATPQERSQLSAVLQLAREAAPDLGIAGRGQS